MERTQMSKKKFRIGDLARELQVKKFVIRFWEKEFELKSDRSQGGQRYYTEDDFTSFKTIKTLLYEEGFTIAGARAQLDKVLKRPSSDGERDFNEQSIQAATKMIEKPVPYIPEEFLHQVRIFKKELLEFKKALE